MNEFGESPIGLFDGIRNAGFVDNKNFGKDF
jgi:hypothetical protein